MFLLSFCDVHWLVPFLLPALLLLIPYMIFRNGWKEKINEISAQRRKDSERLADTEGELNLAKGKLLTVEDKLASVTATNRRLQSQSTALNTSSAISTEETEAYRHKITSLEGELALKNGEVKFAEDKFEKLRQRITQLEGDLALKNGEVNVSEVEHEAYRKRITQLEGELALASGEVKLIEESQESYRRKITASEGGMALQSGSVSHVAEDQQALRQRITALEGELALAKGDVTLQEKHLEENNQKIKALQLKLEQVNQAEDTTSVNHSITAESSDAPDRGDVENDQLVNKVAPDDTDSKTKKSGKSSKKKGQKKKKNKNKKVKHNTAAGTLPGFKQAKAGKFSKVAVNDLTVIEGIGPKAASILAKNGIDSWESLSMKTPAELKEILLAAGSRYSHMDPSTWPRQANLASGNHWTRLQTLQDKIGNRRAQTSGQVDQGIPAKPKSKAKIGSKRKASKANYKSQPKIKDSNLQIIEGIGPKMNELLLKHGLGTWSALAAKSPGEIRLILDEYGDKYKIIDPKDWPKQASYAAKGRWEKLITHQKADGSDSKAEKILKKSGATPAPMEANDLKLIEGIGPKISSILKEQGISTWAQLANTSVKELKSILSRAGSRYGLADPKTWPKQAKLAAAGKFDKLEKLKAAI